MRRLVLCAAVLAGLASLSATAAVDDAPLTSRRGTAGRSLLQIRKNCPANLEAANYTAVTSRCKGPDYNQTRCCAAYRDMACPYADYINDETTTCAATMHSYLGLHGRYPPGLFANTCTHDKNGLRCPDVAATAATAAAAPTSLVATAFAVYMYLLRFKLSVSTLY